MQDELFKCSKGMVLLGSHCQRADDNTESGAVFLRFVILFFVRRF